MTDGPTPDHARPAIPVHRPARRVLTEVLDVPQPGAHIVADWQRDARQLLGLEPGDVESLSLARTRRRWSGYSACMAALDRWAQARGLGTLLQDSPQSLMVCRGAALHHDGAQYGHALFCNLFLGPDLGQDVLFPALGLRIALRHGTVLLFDTWQPHAVAARQRDGFDPRDFADLASSQVFLSWELPRSHAGLAAAMALAV